MQIFLDWLKQRNNSYYKSVIFSEQDGLPEVLPAPQQIPPNSGRYFWILPNPDDPNDTIEIDVKSMNAKQRAMEVVRKNAALGRANVKQQSQAAVAGLSSLTGGMSGAIGGSLGAAAGETIATQVSGGSNIINPQKVDKNYVDVGGGNKISLVARNVMLKREISQKKNIPYNNITDNQLDVELAYMANENDETEFMDSKGNKQNLKKMQQDFINRYGKTPEEQMARGATKEMTRLSPKGGDFTGLRIVDKGSRAPLPKGATIVPRSIDKSLSQGEKNSISSYTLKFRNEYGLNPAKWQPVARAAIGMEAGDKFQIGKFLNYYDQFGKDYTKWSPAQQKEAGIDPTIPLPNILSDENEGGDEQLEDLKKLFDIQDKKALTDKIWNYMNKNVDAIKIPAIKYVVNAVAEDAIDKRALNNISINKLLKRRDLDQDTKNKIANLYGITPEQMGQITARRKAAPLAVKKPTQAAPGGETKEKDPIQNLETMNYLVSLFDGIGELTPEAVTGVYNKNKEMFDKYARSKGLRLDIFEILPELIADKEKLEQEMSGAR